MKNFLFLIFILCAFSGFSQTGGKGVYDFLNMTNSAKIAALGGKNISVYDDDLNFAKENPALLNAEMNDKLVINYVNYFAGVNYGYAGYAFEFKKLGTVSAGIQYINYGNFTAADETGVITGNFTAADYALNLIWSKQLFKNISGGINFKPVYSHYESYNSFGAVFDLGITYYKKETDFAVSLVVKNIGTQIKPYYKGHYESVVFDIQAGVSKKLAHAPFRVNLTAHRLNKWNLRYDVPEEITQISFAQEDENGNENILTNFLDNAMRHLITGVEFMPLKSFYAAISYNHQRHQEMRLTDRSGFTGFSWGFGLKLKKTGFSYGRSSYHLAGGSNHFSVYFDISKFSNKTKVKIN